MTELEWLDELRVAAAALQAEATKTLIKGYVDSWAKSFLFVLNVTGHFVQQGVLCTVFFKGFFFACSMQAHNTGIDTVTNSLSTY